MNAPTGTKQDRESTTMAVLFRSRAVRLRFTAFGILGIIFLLLVGGAMVFILAPQITLSDFSIGGDIDKKLSDVNEEQDKLQKTIDQSQKEFDERTYEWHKLSVPLYETYNNVLSKYTDLAHIRIIGRKPDVLIDDHILNDKTAILGLFNKASQIDSPSYYIQITNPPNVSESYYYLPNEKLKPLITELQATDIGILTAWPGNFVPDPKLTERKKLLEQAVRVLQQRKTEQGLAVLLGTQENRSEPANTEPIIPSKDTQDNQLARLIQTNLTRFGTIIMITFLVSILTPLYRYNIRLATYYDARADVLELFETTLRSVGFLRLATALTPAFDFGKGPNTPIEQIIELVREVTSRKTPNDS
jgi:hypothetical protein